MRGEANSGLSFFWMGDVKDSPDILTLAINADARQLDDFLMILQDGVRVKVDAGRSVTEFLCDEMGLDRKYVMDSIQTVFLDGKPVDNLDSALISDGACLTLSAGMPGLVGATLRRGSILSSFRKSITYRESGNDRESREGYVQVKLFNLMMRQLGPVFLRRGIYVKTSVLSGFFQSREEAFWAGADDILINGRLVGAASLREKTTLKGEWTYLYLFE